MPSLYQKVPTGSPLAIPPSVIIFTLQLQKWFPTSPFFVNCPPALSHQVDAYGGHVSPSLFSPPVFWLLTAKLRSKLSSKAHEGKHNTAILELLLIIYGVVSDKLAAHTEIANPEVLLLGGIRG